MTSRDEPHVERLMRTAEEMAGVLARPARHLRAVALTDREAHVVIELLLEVGAADQLPESYCALADTLRLRIAERLTASLGETSLGEKGGRR